MTETHTIYDGSTNKYYFAGSNEDLEVLRNQLASGGSVDKKFTKPATESKSVGRKKASDKAEKDLTDAARNTYKKDV